MVNSIATDNSPNGNGGNGGFEALVVARPEDIVASGLTVLDLPDALQQPVARQSS